MQSAKEAVSNMAASAKSGMEKTKATAEEKAEKITTRDPLKKDMVEAKKEERIHEAEREKQAAHHHNAAVKETSTTGIHGHTHGTGTTGVAGTGHSTGGTY